MRKLGRDQVGVLETLKKGWTWRRGKMNGWTWGSDSRTTKILDSLCDRGLAEKVEDTYQITDEGKSYKIV